jgi:hypothetical protein
MAAPKPLHHFEAKSADTRISRNEPRIARVDFLLANGESLVVEVPRYALGGECVRHHALILRRPLRSRFEGWPKCEGRE